MNAFKTSISALALTAMAAGGIGAATLLPANVYAETTQTAPAGTPAPDKAMHHEHRRFDPAARARFIEGRIAYIKTVLQITPQQEQAFNGLADAMRTNAKERMAAWEQMKTNRDQPKTIVDRLEMRIKFSQMRTQQQERVLAALKPLYASLTPDQQKTVGALIADRAAHRGWHGHRG